MQLPVVVGVDGSGLALTAVDWAVDEAARRGLPLRLVHASLWERYEGAVPRAGTEPPAERLMAQQVLDTATERARRRDADVKVCTSLLPRTRCRPWCTRVPAPVSSSRAAAGAVDRDTCSSAR